MHPFKHTYRTDIFCRVIDNFGDAGVLWRLSRDLRDYGHDVRLIIDDLNTLSRLVPELDSKENEQVVKGIRVVLWPEAWNSDDAPCPLKPAQWVIEGFACRIPPAYEREMAQSPQWLSWINLDYLSAEDWVEDYHGLPSLHPSLGIHKTFFFPGFTARTGGLIIERDYQHRHSVFNRSAWLRAHGADTDKTTLFFFTYPYAPIAKLAQALAQSARPLQILLSATESAHRLKQAIEAIGAENISLVQLPFIAQENFDEVLWACDLAFIRGEDSAARAQLAGCPFAWHIYHQDDGAHRIKLSALAEKMLQALSDDPLMRQWQAWQADFNEGIVDAVSLCELLEKLPQLKVLHQHWSETLHKNGPLAHKLAQCVEKR